MYQTTCRGRSHGSRPGVVQSHDNVQPLAPPMHRMSSFCAALVRSSTRRALVVLLAVLAAACAQEADVVAPTDSIVSSDRSATSVETASRAPSSTPESVPDSASTPVSMTTQPFEVEAVSTVAEVVRSDPSTVPPTTINPCPVGLSVVTAGTATQATIYRATLPAGLVGARIRLVVDDAFVVDTQISTSSQEFLTWQPGSPTPSPTAAGIVAIIDTGDGTPQMKSCSIPPLVASSLLTSEQIARAGSASALSTFQSALDAKVGTTGIPAEGYGDTVRVIALPAGLHTILVSYQRDRCVEATNCPASLRLDPYGVETTSLFCIDFSGARFKLVEATQPDPRLLDIYAGWPTLEQILADHAAWCG